MRLQLDTDAKTIKLMDNVKLSELFEKLEKILPNGEWKKFTLETSTSITQWSFPTIIKEYPAYPSYPWYYSTGTNLNKSDCSFKSGSYNIEM